MISQAIRIGKIYIDRLSFQAAPNKSYSQPLFSYSSTIECHQPVQ
jgi:hypothetical protein